MAECSPISFSPIRHSPMAKVPGRIGENTVNFHQLAKFQGEYGRKYDGLSPIGDIPGKVLAKVWWTFSVVTKLY